MKQKPIIFSTPMVKAILEGRKTQTRRVIKPQLEAPIEHDNRILILDGWLFYDSHNQPMCRWVKLPYQPGDVLWVRETWFYETHMHDLTVGEPDLPSGRYRHRYAYRADNPDYPVDVGGGWKPSIFMPREVARIFLRVKNVRVERLQDITYEDAIAEGAKGIYNFSILWDSINAKRGYGWDVNPWVWVVEFSNLTLAKAILELEMPKSCWECPLVQGRELFSCWCGYNGKYCPSPPYDSRRLDCPLKEVQNEKNSI